MVFIAHILRLKPLLAPQVVQEELVLAAEHGAVSFTAALSILGRPLLLEKLHFSFLLMGRKGCAFFPMIA